MPIFTDSPQTGYHIDLSSCSDRKTNVRLIISAVVAESVVNNVSKTELLVLLCC